MAGQCSHLEDVKAALPRTNGCEECLKTGDSWVHLRLCETWRYCYIHDQMAES